MSLPKLNNFPPHGGVPVWGELTAEQVAELERAAKSARIAAVTMVSAAKSGHPGGAFSSMEMYLAVYGVANLTPENCDSLDRDYVVVSHGHTSAGAYAAMAEYGFFDREEAMAHFRHCGSAFQGHVTREVPGVDWGTGNLGQGLSAGAGFALAQRARGYNGRVYVLMGDGGQTKGQIAEARRLAVKEGLTGLVALVDWNDIQINGDRNKVMPCNLKAIWEADGWEAVECDGHSFTALYAALRDAGSRGRPTVLLCRTVMGRDGGVMEGIPDYHGKAPSPEVYAGIVRGLGGDPEDLTRALEARKNPPEYKGRRIDFPPAPSLDTGTPIEYRGAKASDNRGAFGKALADVGSLNHGKDGRTPIIVFDCDLAPSVMTGKFRDACPDEYVQCGIQEHNTATAAGAASIAGVVTVWADFGVFGIDEVYNQQRLNDINHAACKTVLTHVGLDVGEDGKTHQCIDYVGLVNNMFGCKLVVPADPNETDRATRWMLAERGDICMAVGRSKVDAINGADGEPVFGGNHKFEYGRATKVREGGNGSIFALGAMTQRAIAAAEILAKDGIEASVWSVSCPLEPDMDALREAAKSGPILTVEDHHVDTGMGAIMTLAAVRGGIALPKIRNLGVSRYGASGSSDSVYADMGLDANGIAAAFRGLA